MEHKGILASVGGRTITEADVEALLHGLDPHTAMQFNSPEGKRHLVEELINQELLFLDAMAKGLERDPQYVAEVERMKANILKQFAISKLLSDVTVSEDDVRKFYEENQEHLQSPESVRASHILVDDEETAKKIIDELNNGLSFEEAANKYSSCPSKSQGGDLGFFTKGRMVPEFEDAAFGLEQDVVSEPVETQFGYHIIKVTDKREPGVQQFDEISDQLEEQVLQQKQQETYLNKVRQLSMQYPVKRNF